MMILILILLMLIPILMLLILILILLILILILLILIIKENFTKKKGQDPDRDPEKCYPGSRGVKKHQIPNPDPQHFAFSH
jgi:hypothetical protein